jgi:lysophospholipase L1-like esterase
MTIVRDRLARLGRVRWLAALGLVLFGLGIGLVLLEVLLRVVPGLMPLHALARVRFFRDLGTVQTRPDADLGFLYPPNVQATMRLSEVSFKFSTDAHGFRNRQPWPARADVVALGDSLTFGFGVPDGHSWVDLAARGLGHPAVVNLALPGFGPLQELRVYERFGAPLRPKLVLVGFFPANDFSDTARFLTWLGLDEGGNYLLWRDFGVTGRDKLTRLDRLLSTSYLHSFLWSVLNPETREYGRRAIVHRTPQGRLRLHPGALRALRQRASPSRPEFVETLDAFQRLDRLVRADGGRVVILILPSKEYVYLPLRRPMKRDPLANVYTALDDRGLTYVNLAPLFRERAAAGERLFFEFDGHPNQRGYALIAEAVVRYVDTKL